ncbi:MAG: peptidoglycan DD-metalloendopeptidase family protein [Bacteroidota bacterium]|nr:peptidoglycan DD-metalloendopeptidase family protein [Bacteroidota bacterium]
MWSRKFSFLFLIFYVLSIGLNSQQTRKSLEIERDTNLKKINEAEKILKETEQSKNATIGRLKVINKQINNRQNLILNLRKDIRSQNNEISSLRILISSLTNDLIIMNKEYSEMIYYSYKSRSSLDKLSYIFSSQNYNQMFRRLNYIFQYSNIRKNQILEIENVKNELSDQEQNLLNIKIKKDDLLKDELSENNKLQKLQNRQKKTISDLNKKQNRIRKEIKERKIALDKLDELIRGIIRRERELTSSTDENVNLLELTEGFEARIGKLQWPVKSGFISNKFGEHPHPVIKNIKVKNDGIDIQTNKSSKVYSVFSGKVSTVAFIPGMNNVVIINHGEYYTLYAKLKNLNVVKGDNISSGDLIAELVTNADGITELQFQVWKNNIKLNPEKWIMKK